MPVYEYECESCSCRFELRQSFDDSPVAICPQCQNSARRVFSPVPIIFKGSGFYATDSRNIKRKGKRDGDQPGDKIEESLKKAKEEVTKAKD